MPDDLLFAGMRVRDFTDAVVGQACTYILGGIEPDEISRNGRGSSATPASSAC